MNLLQKTLAEHEEDLTSLFVPELRSLYGNMDQEYERAAGQYGFACRGCEDNCCLTRFHHHTVLEYALLLEGFRALGPAEKDRIQTRAAGVMGAYRKADAMGRPVRVMCPLNDRGLCGLYDRRPMICRLHGLPHELNPAAGRKVFGPGCGAFDLACKGQPYLPFDRTPFYRRMADLEQRLRQVLGYSMKIKLTLAEMVTLSEI